MTDNNVYRSVIFGGDGAVGKTSMCLSYKNGESLKEFNHIPTKIEHFLLKDFLINGKTVSVGFNDHEAGGEDWDALRHLGYRDVDCVVLCFSIDSKDSFEYINEYWYPFTKRYCPKAKRILVGMKKDLRDDKDWIERLAKHDEKLVTNEEGEKLSKKIKAEYYLECSSVTREGIEDVFNKAAEVASTVNINHYGRKCSII